MLKSNIRHLRVSPELFIAMCRENPNQEPSYWAVTKNPLPSDAVVIGISTIEYNTTGLILDLEIESEEFADNVPDPLPPVEHTQMLMVIRGDLYTAGRKEDE